MEIKNAIITAARISIDDRAPLTAWLTLDYSGSGQGFGGHTLYLPEGFKYHAEGGNFGGLAIYRILQVAGVEEWSKVVGKAIRVRVPENGYVAAIGHIIHDDWYEPAKDFTAHKDAVSRYHRAQYNVIPDGLYEALGKYGTYPTQENARLAAQATLDHYGNSDKLEPAQQ